MEKSLHWINCWPKPFLTIVSLALVFVVGAIDYATGLDVSVSLFYLVPVCLSSWYAGRASGLSVACASAIVWLAADVLNRAVASHPLVAVWNTLMLAASFIVVALLVTAHKERNEDLEATVLRRTEKLRDEIVERHGVERQLNLTNAELLATRAQLQRSLADLQRSHDELQNTQLQLIEAAKMESVGRLAAGVAHEVKNPLMTLSLGADYFVRRGSGNDGEAVLLRDMKEAVQRASTIINLLLDFTKPRPLQRTSEDLNLIIENSLSLVRHQLLEHHVTLVRELQSSLPLLSLDRNRIEHVFVNLFINAAQAMTDGGTLTVRTRTGASVMNGNGEPASITVDVEDTGRGIPQEHLSKLFEPFFTTKPPGEGTGLGLAIVRRIVEIHGGSITLCNRTEGGARATVKFNV